MQNHNPVPSTATQVDGTDEVEKVFRKFDSDGDGKISLTELAAILDVLGSTTPKEEVARVMSELDVDGDGFIDFSEFKSFHCGGEDKIKELKEAYDLYDRDKDGKISAAELLAVLETLGETCTLTDCGKMISTVDVDGDGFVNFEEFKKMMTGASS